MDNKPKYIIEFLGQFSGTYYKRGLYWAGTPNIQEATKLSHKEARKIANSFMKRGIREKTQILPASE